MARVAVPVLCRGMPISLCLTFFLNVNFWNQSALASEKERGPRIGVIDGTVSLATDYVFRGISQTTEQPQLQLDVSWTHKSGWYAGVWSSNTEFGGPGNSMEIDPYLGFSANIEDTDVSFDIGYWHYHYPGAQSDYDYGEFYASASYGLESVNTSLSVFYADDYFGDDFFGNGSSFAYQGKLTYVYSNNLSLSARLGRQTFDQPSALSSQDYTYFDAGLSAPWIGFVLDLRWYDSKGVEASLAPEQLSDGRLVFRVSRKF